MLGPKFSWKNTLHLPKTAFPARAIVGDQPNYIQQCTEDLYVRQQSRKLEQTFTLHDGPPYANGDLHLGHALNKILKDIICRSRLPGHRVTWRPGWDCHGLPIELKALQQQSNKSTRNAVDIRAAAKQFATRTVQEQKLAFQKWGIMADWSNGWTTMDKDFEVKQLGVFQAMANQGLIYRGHKPVYWSPSSRTALAEAELEYRDDHVSTAAFVKFPLASASQAFKKQIGMNLETVNAVIWTTLPWTIPANQAIGIHEDIEYVVGRSRAHGRLLVASSRLPIVERHLNHKLSENVTCKGKDIIGTMYSDSAFNRNSLLRPVLHADFVSEASGSGLVHFAPGHGMDEYELCLKRGIPASAPVNEEGRFTAAACHQDPQYLLGKEVLQAGNQAVLRRLRDHGQLLDQHSYTHSYPYDWRTKQPVIVRATEQWFANISEVQDHALKSLQTVQFIPSSSRLRLESFIKTRSEWCISRQRAWGVPIPALYHVDTDEPLLTQSSVHHIISIIKDRGIDAWWSDEELDPAWTPPSIRNSDGSTQYRRGKDTMDVWFDSGSSWTQIEPSGSESSRVADCFIEGTDQHRGWFQSSLLTYVSHQKSSTAPFKTLITHGFTLDQDGRKMSKSIGNVISPNEIMDGSPLPPIKRKIKGRLVEFQEALGADALRLWVASCDFTADVRINQEVLQGIHTMLAKYRVTFKLIIGLLQDFEPKSDVSAEDLSLIHNVVLWRLDRVNMKVQQHFFSFEINRAVSEINRFITNDLSSSYFEWIKDAAYCGTDSERLQIQTTLYQIYCHLQQMLAPITTLLIQEAWHYTPDQCKEHESLPPGLRPWIRPVWREADRAQLTIDIPHVLEARDAIKGVQEIARHEKRMGDSLESCACLEIRSTIARNIFSRYDITQLQTIFGVSGLKVVSDISDFPEIRQAGWSYQGQFEVEGDEICVHVYEPQLAKCPRCWRYAAPEGIGREETLCERCEEVVGDMAETQTSPSSSNR